MKDTEAPTEAAPLKIGRLLLPTTNGHLIVAPERIVPRPVGAAVESMALFPRPLFLLGQSVPCTERVCPRWLPGSSLGRHRAAAGSCPAQTVLGLLSPVVRQNAPPVQSGWPSAKWGWRRGRGVGIWRRELGVKIFVGCACEKTCARQISYQTTPSDHHSRLIHYISKSQKTCFSNSTFSAP